MYIGDVYIKMKTSEDITATYSPTWKRRFIHTTYVGIARYLQDSQYVGVYKKQHAEHIISLARRVYNNYHLYKGDLYIYEYNKGQMNTTSVTNDHRSSLLSATKLVIRRINSVDVYSYF